MLVERLGNSQEPRNLPSERWGVRRIPERIENSVQQEIIIGNKKFKNWEDLEVFFNSRIPSNDRGKLHIVDRCNWTAEIEKAGRFRSKTREFVYQNAVNEQLREFRACVDTLYREFCLSERIYCYDRKVVRKKFGDNYLYKVVSFDNNDPIQGGESIEDAFSRIGMIAMLNRAIDCSGSPIRDRAYLDGFKDSYRQWIGDLSDNDSTGSVYLHLSPPPNMTDGKSKEGYGTHSFLNWNIVERARPDELLIHVVNMRTEYSVEQQLFMLSKILQGEDLVKVQKFLKDIESGGEIAIEEFLKLSIKLPIKCGIDEGVEFVNKMYQFMEGSNEINARNAIACEREMRYRELCLTNEDIGEIRVKLEKIQELYVEALLSGTSLSTLKSIINYLEHQANVLYCEYKYKERRSVGGAMLKKNDYLIIARSNNQAGNTSCPANNVDSRASIQIIGDGGQVMVNGERIENPVVTCPDALCKCQFRVYSDGVVHKVCPKCGWDPCLPDTTGKTSENKEKGSNFSTAKNEVFTTSSDTEKPKKVEYVQRGDSGAKLSMMEVEKLSKSARYDQDSGLYFLLIFGVRIYYSVDESIALSKLHALDKRNLRVSAS
ncbi:MAG: hypothetical protein M3P33_00850 [bacterium]|nr:hypothetical protein [bacterium]